MIMFDHIMESCLTMPYRNATISTRADISIAVFRFYKAFHLSIV